MPAKKQLTTEEKHELIGVIIQSMQWMSDAAVESDDETVNSTFDDIEDWLTELAFGRDLN
jgi:hypothetical protein